VRVVTAESAQAAVVFLIALLMLLGGALALLGLLARGDLAAATRGWAWAWAALFLGGGFLLLHRAEFSPIAAGLTGLAPALFLAAGLAFVGRPVPRWVVALVPLGGLLSAGSVPLGPGTALGWAAFILVIEGSAAVVLYRGTRGSPAERPLPFAMGFFAITHAAGTVLYAEQGLTQSLTLAALPMTLLIVAQSLGLQERARVASARKERERRESEYRFRSLADLSNLVVLILDTDHRVVEWNPAAEAIYGWPREKALGRDYLETFLPEEVRPAIQTEISRIVAGGQAHGYENPVLTREGERILRWNVTRLQAEAEQPYGLLCLGEDVTDERRLREEQHRLFAAVEQAGEAVAVADRWGIIVYANPALCRMMEKDLSEVVGHSMRNVVYGQEDEQLVADILGQLRRGEIWKGRYTTHWPDGRSFVRDATVAPVRDDEGDITHAVALLRDVTREQELEREVAHSQKLTALGTLAGGIAHDFNNLLTAVIGGAHLLLEEQTPGETKRTAEEILEAAQRGASLSRQLLAFSRRQPLRPEVIDLDAVVTEMRALLERLIGEHIELETESADPLWRVSAERSQLEQVIMNLVLNARDAMPDGGRLTIRTGNRTFATDDPDRPGELAPGEYVSLCVLDTGAGMDEETRSRAFEPFFTRKAPGSGTGLGLATVFGIARQSGGDVALLSEPGQGSRVDVYLPRARGPVAEDAPPGPPVRLGGNETILLVEDDAMVRRIARRTLEELGYRVLEAEDGERARTRLEETEVDLLVTDMVMPGISGLELVDALRQSHPEIRVLLISGYEGGPDSAPPSAPLLEKPFTPDQLARKVHEVLRGLRASPPPAPT
jgi:PAS domain S-box-containing protein